MTKLTDAATLRKDSVENLLSDLPVFDDDMAVFTLLVRQEMRRYGADENMCTVLSGLVRWQKRMRKHQAELSRTWEVGQANKWKK